MPLSIPYPSWLKPEVIPGLPVRWYGVMYIVAFGITYLMYRRQIKERNFPMNDDDLSSMFFWIILSLILGARIFHSVIYETKDLVKPWLIFWPFRDGRFTGFQGMSYHGGVIGFLTAMFIFSYKKKYDVREIGDMFAAGVPLGYTFGRIGNFINAELSGRITASPIGMVFPNNGIYPTDRDYGIIRDGAAAMGLDVTTGFGGVLNLPRHPSQLYEALFEGIVLWAIIWLLRKHKPFKGFLTAVYISGYGLFRFFIEYFREPDAALGYRLQFVKNDLPPALSHPLLCFSTGQILCFGMILLGIAGAIIASRMENSEGNYFYREENVKVKNDAERAAKRNKRRKSRKKLR